MDNNFRLFEQVAAESDVSKRKAKSALYLHGLAAEGRTLEQVSVAMRRSPSTIKGMCRDFLIDLADYTPFKRARDNGTSIEARIPISSHYGA